MRNFADVNLDEVKSVYSGRADRCCCGCSGIHSKANGDAAAKRKVKNTFDLLKREIANVRNNEEHFGFASSMCFTLERGVNRLHVVYLD